MYFLIILLLVILLIVFMPLEVYVHMEHNHVDVNIRLFKFIKIELSRKTKDKVQKEGRLRFKDIPFEVIKEVYHKSIPNFKYILKKLKIKLKVNFDYGLSAPDKTAISYGIINSLIYSVDNLIGIYLKKFEREYTIIPDMKNKKLEYQVTISVYTWSINLLVYGFKMLPILFKYRKYFIKKGGDKNVRTSNTGANENYNG